MNALVSERASASPSPPLGAGCAFETLSGPGPVLMHWDVSDGEYGLETWRREGGRTLEDRRGCGASDSAWRRPRWLRRAQV